MSLINDALKKAELERGQRSDPEHSHPQPRSGPGRPGRGWRYLRGFLISMLVVGTGTTLLTHYFVTQLLEPPSAASGPDHEPEAVNALSATLPAPDPEPPVVISEPSAGEAPGPIELARQTIEKGDTRLSAVQDALLYSTEQAATVATASDPTPDLPEIEASADDTSASSEETSAPTEGIPNRMAAAVAFAEQLEGLEVRGLMAANGRVLIFDGSNGRTRAYSVGDVLDGLPTCKILAIEGKSVRIGGPDGHELTIQLK
jgi:hypothetical protein